jgi:predicted dehydrogenase
MVGCGDIAGYLAQVSRLVRQVSLAACCDVDAGRAQAFARKHGIPLALAEYAAVLELPEVEAVYLAVPHDLHAGMILSAARAGKHVLVEKPITRTLAEAQQLLPLLDGLPVKVGVNYQFRYDRGCYALARAVQAGELGEIYSARINVPWHRTQSYFTNSAWHQSFARAGGGTLLTQASHFLDIVLWALDDLPASAMGYTASPGFAVEVDTLAHGIVQTRRGALISITSSMVAVPEQLVTIEIYGERGAAVYRSLPSPHVKFLGRRVRQASPPGWGVHALQRSLAGFARWTLENEPFLIPAASAVPVLAAVDGIYRSAHTGERSIIDQ